MAEFKQKEQFRLIVPLDASGVEDFKPEQEPNVVVKDSKGILHAMKVKFDSKGHGTATFTFSEHPGNLSVSVGPGDATDEEVLALETLNFTVSVVNWKKQTELKIRPLRITPYYWHWWLRWCRVFTIRGRVVCPDNSPVPGAHVSAYDVDRWFFWSSKQLVGSSTTDANGEFQIKFRWCCGWWPWWWWRYRVWQLDPILIKKVDRILKAVPEFKLSRIDNQPSLSVFKELLPEEHLGRRGPLNATDIELIPKLRDRLLAELPVAPELERLQIWPWYPWFPWRDCTPDIIFKITQDCNTHGEVIYEEDAGQTRWNISNPLEEILVVKENACCIPSCPNPPCEEGECLILDTVCDIPFDEIGGNPPGAGTSPVGYWNPGPVPVNSYDHHRPFADIIPIKKNPGDMLGVDYYEIEYFDDTLVIPDWVPLPAGAAISFYRQFWETATFTSKWLFFPFTPISGHNVIETREHYEVGSGMTWDMPGGDAWWMSSNWNLLLPLDTTKFNDGTYRFRIVGWKSSGGALTTSKILPICGSKTENEFVLTIDNRVIESSALHDSTHNCGGIHICTKEPDTHIISVKVDGVVVNPCDTVEIKPGGILEIDFLASDSDNHLAYYVISSAWGLNQSRNLLNRPGVNVAVISGGPTGWVAGQSTGNYGTAVSQGAVVPHWGGGKFRLTMPMSEAFPEPCCYQLELWAFKRSVVGQQSGKLFGCNKSFQWGINGNKTEYSLGVGVCPPVIKITPELPDIRIHETK